MVILAAWRTRRAADDAIIMTYINTPAFSIKIHNNGLMGTLEVNIFSYGGAHVVPTL